MPYFKDTTPQWSTRGKLRTRLVPLLKEMYGDGVLRNLSALGAESDGMRELAHRCIFEPFLKGVRRSPPHSRMAVWADCNGFCDR